MKQANHGGVKSNSVEDSESVMLDSEVSTTPSRQRRPVRSAADAEVDSEDQLSQADDAADSMQQEDVTVGFDVLCFVLVLLPCDAVLARYMLSSFVCLSVCLSQAGTVPKRQNIESRKQLHTIVHGL